MNCPTNEALLAYASSAVDTSLAFGATAVALDATHQAELDAHIAACSTCHGIYSTAVSAGRTALGTPPPGQPGPTYAPNEPLPGASDVRIGERYEVKRLLGRGGMGAVYLAKDRTLGRDVAVKLHGVGSGSDRLQREAIAMAKLAHPNVVTVFEVASFEERLYVAMEYVKGGTLNTWLRAQPRAWRETIELLLGAGEGLAAAHDAELVHRDFKPDNVLVGEDGRPRVGDFGIARLEGRNSDQIISVTASIDPTAPMTMTGSVMGTPAYMAPEQLVGEEVDARADQFAFCVVAWECLFGVRPFAGTSLQSLAASIALARFERPVRTEVPQKVIDIVARGLSADPDKRYPHMRALLGELRRVTFGSKRRWVMGVALAAIPVAVIATALTTRSSNSAAVADACAGGEALLAGAWDRSISDKLRTQFISARPKDGADIHARVASAFDAYAKSWIDARHAACVATRISGNQSEAALDLRMSCLERKRVEMMAFARGLADADDAMVLGAQRGVFGLSSLSACADVAGLSGQVQPPDPQTRIQIETLRAALAEANALRLLGKIPLALDKAKEVAAKASALKYRPLEAEALLLAGDLEERAGNAEAGIKGLQQAIVAANAGHHLLAAAEAWSRLAWIVGYRDRDFDKAMLDVQMAAAAIEGAGGSPELSAQLLSYEGLILDTKNKLDDARTKYLASLAAYETMGAGDDPKVTLVLNDLGGVERKRGDFPAAMKYLERALEIRIRYFGENHPWVFSSVLNIGNVAWSKNDYATAEKWYQRALAIATQVFPPNHNQTALVLGNLAAVYDSEDRSAEAIAMYKRVLAMVEVLHPPKHPQIADVLRSLGNAYVTAKQRLEAKAAFDRALEIMTGKEDDPMLRQLCADYGQLLIEDDPRRAEQLLLRAVKLNEDANPEDPELAYPLTALGMLYLETKRAAAARGPLERAHALRATDPEVDIAAWAGTELTLAKALWTTPADRARARELVTEALARLDKAKRTGEAHAALTAWLAVHSR